jgi:histidyl-tRNA synthetase
LIILAVEILKKLELKNIELKLSHAGIIRALLLNLGLSPVEQAKLFDQILDGDVAAMARVTLGESEPRRALTSLLDLKGKSSGFLKNLKALFTKNFPELESPLNDFISIVDLLETLGGDCKIDLASGRGFEYYTGVIFQLFMGEENIGGGGRYDALIPLMGGKNVPASGFALYLDRLMSLVKPETLVEPLMPRILVRVEPEAMEVGFTMAGCLREAGYVAELYLGGQQPANLRWTVDAQNRVPQFVLTDQVKGRKFVAQTVTEVLTLLREREGVDKNSIT